MTIIFIMFANSSTPAGFWVPADVFAPVNPPALASLVFSSHTSLPVI